VASDPKDVLPDAVLRTVVAAIPETLRQHVIVIGSLAAAYWHTGPSTSFSVRTKDVDTVLVPRGSAPQNGRDVADELLRANWKPKRDGEFGAPGDETTPDDKLPALRLYPPESEDWFLELLTEPDGEAQDGRNFMRIVLSNREHYGLPSFQFTSVATFEAVQALVGIRVAKPEMMALANLLEHPMIKPDVIKGTTIKRSNKDLGRSLALAWLTEGKLDSWHTAWLRALQTLFPRKWPDLAKRSGNGMRAMLESETDLDQALSTCNNGLLASKQVTREQLRATAKRLLEIVIAEIETAAADDNRFGGVKSA
jgi:hypothetical protein